MTLTQASPLPSASASRRSRSTPDPRTASGLLQAARGFDFAASIGFLRGFSPMFGDQRVGDASVTKAFLHRGQAVVMELHAGPEPATIDYALRSSSPLSVATTAYAREHIVELLSAHEDMAPFHRRAEADASFAPVARRLAGLHHVKFPTAFEAACWGTIHQRVQRAQARAMKEALCRTFGGVVREGGRELLAFPEPETLARATEAELERAMGNARKAKVVAALARAFASVDPSFLRTTPLPMAEAWLRDIHGVGPFTSGFVLFRGLGRYAGLPMSEGLRDAASAVYGRRMTHGEIAEVAASYGAWGGHWALYVRASTFAFAHDPG